MKRFYLCDGKKCAVCSSFLGKDGCHYTTDIRHARMRGQPKTMVAMQDGSAWEASAFLPLDFCRPQAVFESSE